MGEASGRRTRRRRGGAFGLVYAAGWLSAACSSGGVMGAPGGRAGGSSDAGSGPSTDARTADGTVPDAVIGSVDASEDSPLTVVCPTAPPVDLDAIPGFKAACTRLVFVASAQDDFGLAVSTAANGPWTTAYTSDAGQYAQISNFSFGLGFGFAVAAGLRLSTTNGTSWSVPDAGPPTSAPAAFAFTDKAFVYASRSGSSFSFNGESWQTTAGQDPYPSGALANFPGRGVAFGPVGADGGTGTFIAVGSDDNSGPDGGQGASVAGYRRSTDGINWSDDVPLLDATGQALNGYLTSVAFGNGHFVAVGDANGAPSPNADGLLAWSKDGTHWTVQTNADRPSNLAVHFGVVARSNTTFLAASNLYSAPVQWLSADGETWTQNTKAPGFGSLQGFEDTFIGGAVNGQPAGTVAISTDDGQTWSMQTALPNKQNVISVGVGRVLLGH